MIKLEKNEMKDISGGAVKWGVIAGIGAFASFVFGIIDGIINPQKCNN